MVWTGPRSRRSAPLPSKEPSKHWQAAHGLLEAERAAIIDLATAWEQVDLTHRKLAHRGSRLGTVYVSESSVLFRPALGKAGIVNPKDYRIHDLRHTFASLNAKNGIAPKELQKVLGHKTLAFTTDTYMHLYQDDFGGLRESLDRAMRPLQEE